jgi:hypothetical protein
MAILQRSVRDVQTRFGRSVGRSRIQASPLPSSEVVFVRRNPLAPNPGDRRWTACVERLTASNGNSFQYQVQAEAGLGFSSN